jgi:hypothetical protein
MVDRQEAVEIVIRIEQLGAKAVAVVGVLVAGGESDQRFRLEQGGALCRLLGTARTPVRGRVNP